MKKIKIILEAIVFTVIVTIVLWLGAFLLRDKSEFFCKLSFGEYRTIFANITTGDSIPHKDVCTSSPIFKIFEKNSQNIR